MDLRKLAHLAAGETPPAKKPQGRPTTKPWSPAIEHRRTQQREWARAKRQRQQGTP
jgi:hypothetical protein